MRPKKIGSFRLADQIACLDQEVDQEARGKARLRRQTVDSRHEQRDRVRVGAVSGIAALPLESRVWMQELVTAAALHSRLSPLAGSNLTANYSMLRATADPSDSLFFRHTYNLSSSVKESARSFCDAQTRPCDTLRFSSRRDRDP